MTTYEKKFREDVLFKYDSMKCFGLVLGLFSRRVLGYYTFKMKEQHSKYTGFIWAIGGFYIFQILGLKMISNKGEFIKLRLLHERNINFTREINKEILEEYPFEDEKKGIFGDNYIKLSEYEKNRKNQKAKLNTKEV